MSRNGCRYKKLTYRVTIEVLDEAPLVDVRNYVKNAIISWGGCLHKDDPLFSGNIGCVSVARVRNGLEIYQGSSSDKVSVLCHKTVVMDDGDIAFCNGKTYTAERFGHSLLATNEQGVHGHVIKDMANLKEWFDKHFEVLPTPYADTKPV